MSCIIIYYLRNILSLNLNIRGGMMVKMGGDRLWMERRECSARRAELGRGGMSSKIIGFIHKINGLPIIYLITL